MKGKSQCMVCRVCLTENENLQSIFCSQKGLKVSAMLMAAAKVQIFPNDGLPEVICGTCTIETVQVYEFKQKCENSDKKLRHQLDTAVRDKRQLKTDEIEASNKQTNKSNQNFIQETEIEIEEVSDSSVCQTENTIEMNDSLISNQESDEAISIIIESENYASSFLCSHCDDCFLREKDLALHVNQKHAKPIEKANKEVICNICFKRYRSQNLLNRHVARMHTAEKMKKRYPNCCSTCKTSFTGYEQFQIHMNEHSDHWVHSCEVCHKSFNKLNNLKIHMRTHTDEKPFLCTTCGKLFKNSGSFRRHAVGHAKPDMGGGFASKEKLSDKLTRPTEAHLFACPECNKSFPNSPSLAKHRKRIHSVLKQYECDVCEMKFARSSNLATHKNIHTGVRPYKCTTCNKTFNQSDELRVHLRVHTKERPYKCSTCKMAFNQSSGLRMHLRIHTGEKPYKCSTCTKAFTQKDHLKTHMRIHTGEKPYKCSTCKKAFSQKDNLITHMRTHTGEKPYECEVCQIKFSQWGSLARHKRLHTGVRPYKIFL